MATTFDSSNHDEMKTRHWAFGILSIFSSFFAFGQKSEIFSTKEGAIRGYDPVAFFKENKPVEGKKELSLSWHDAIWHFANQENLDAFKSDPEKYAPQYGGYCAYGTAKNHLSPTLPETWTILEGKLYFNYNMEVKQLWTKDQKQLITDADKNWPGLKK